MPNLHGSPGALGPASEFSAILRWPDGRPEGAATRAGKEYGRPGRHGRPVDVGLDQQEEAGRLNGLLQFVPTLLQFWRLREEDAVPLLGFNREDAAHVALALRGQEHFRGRDVWERIAHLVWIRTSLSALFRDLDTENAWLREPHSWLDERVPMQLLLGGSMEDLLLVRDYVDTAN